MRAVGAPEPLDRAVGAPSGFQEEVNTPLLVFGIEAGVVTAARPAGIREDQDALGTGHECRGFGKIGAG